MLWRHARSTAREFALFAFIVVTTACFEHVLDSTAPAIGGQPIARPAPFDAKVAFVSNRDGESYIYLAPEDGSAVHRFVRGEQPAIRDGERLLFVCHLARVRQEGMRRCDAHPSPWGRRGDKPRPTGDSGFAAGPRMLAQSAVPSNG